MTTARSYVFAFGLMLCVAYGCGRESETSNPSSEPPVSLELLIPENPLTIQAPAPFTIMLMVVGQASESAVISSPDLPGFASLTGKFLTLLPSYSDAGQYTITLIASIPSGASATATLRLEVTRSNSPPMWLPALVFEDGQTMGGYPQFSQSPTLVAVICDKEGDDITFEAEVVPRGHEFVKQATYSQTVDFTQIPPISYYKDTWCTEFHMPFSGIAGPGVYEVAIRTRDGLGAADPYGDEGWCHFGGFTLLASGG